ncbi:pentatricopeptide repeat-containing protein [Pyrus ussuriensis x Pyrus communis]|uniref:Pentatricopeptide repeat-containing protein n=1 Tax=Pyrus ussuriensis x Pyrus communis TaxID=2448454 RepID=A0A5N5IBV4_9ROSA|nr:pentatricopeptide repeat-containing protein [Pyrus ussuriensis x Pyrus communis]
MRTLRRRNLEGLFFPVRNYCRHLSAIANGPQQSPVTVGAEDARDVCTPLVHEILQICAGTGAPAEGKACHAHIIRAGLVADTLTSNMLINMCYKCGLLDCAGKVFDEMPERSLVSWYTMIGSLSRNGEEQEAVDLFLQMQRQGNPFSEFTVSSVLCACAAKCAVFACKQLHAFAVKLAMNLNVYVGIALLDVYAKSGLIKDASSVFEPLPERSDVTWSSMVAGYVQNELYEEEQNQFTVSSAICACAGLAALIEGKQLHALLSTTGFGLNVFTVSSLIDMYAKCGSIREAYSVFQGMNERNIVLWKAMISGFARHACSLEVMVLLEKMQQIGMFPGEVTYVSVLTACSHMGLVESGKKYFNLMITEHNVSPNVVHYSCMVDILGRSGLILEAYDLIQKIPFGATASMWGSLLASCRIHGNIDLAEVATKHLSEIEPNNAGNHILLSNVYAANNKWGEVARRREILIESELKKEREGRKVALTFGLMCLPSNVPIGIMKNLRICVDCHAFMKVG